MSSLTIASYERLRAAIARERLPVALVDMDAVDANADQLIADVRAYGKTLRLATKSVRCPALIDYLVDRGGDTMRGLMAFTVEEAELLVERGHTDILIAYPSVQPSDVERLIELNRRQGVRVCIIVDSEPHLELLATGATERGGEIPVAIEVDLSLRALGGRLHLGVHRSPLHTAEEVVRLARSIQRRDGLRLAGIMGYEAQVAGMGEANPFSRALNPIKSAIKRASVPAVRKRRQQVAEALAQGNLAIEFFNGGGTGSLITTGLEAAVTEVTAGSGFLCSHLFDYYPHLSLVPAAFFALQVVRLPAPGYVTCHGGGLIASGEPGPDRLPLPVLPPELQLTQLEGAGEVQTPLHGAGTERLAIGDPVFFRHAKAGELAEAFNEYVLVRGSQIVDRVRTYRGLGHAFL